MKAPIFHRMFDYDRKLLPNSYLARLESGVRTIEEARKRTGASIGYPGWGVIYHLLLAHLDRNRREVLVETGTNWGATTIVMAQALEDADCDGQVVTFEIDPGNVDIARRHVAAAGLTDRVEFQLGDSRELMRHALDGREPIRFAFLDASHLYDSVLGEFDLLLPRLSSDAIVLFDNTYRITHDDEDARVNGALLALRARYGGNLVNLEFVSWYTPGLAIWQKEPRL